MPCNVHNTFANLSSGEPDSNEANGCGSPDEKTSRECDELKREVCREGVLALSRGPKRVRRRLGRTPLRRSTLDLTPLGRLEDVIAFAVGP